MMIQIKRPHVFIVRKEASSSKSSFCVQTILQSIGTSLTSEARPSRECPDGGSTMVHQRGDHDGDSSSSSSESSSSTSTFGAFYYGSQQHSTK
mmetsp:Transcript_2897/g.6430  ORF Transcript_2897/g.6430 Transcript_2897/m.6430 type:complete len:93 (-) Transcript_2897:173-451(-)